ncbi:HSP90 family protein [Actinoplanes sp. NPDC049668]|uniref:HSP90 family protein n=1 Tax=unclassified Actinoplanes TaxID=2626549 RepID=UPI0033AD2E99
MSNTFQVDLRGIVDLLSHHLYASPRVYVRELLQNAVDAITAVRQGEPATAGRIVIESADATGDGSLRIADDGIGLTEAQVHELLATIGRSSKRDELGFARHEFLGQFGIGLLSCFLVADEIRVHTRQAGSPPVLWTGYADGRYDVRTGPEREPGTTVTLLPRRGAEMYLVGATVTQLATLYGSLLPVEVTVDGTVVTVGEVPWAAGRRACIAYAERTLGFTPFDVIELDVPEAGLTGAAFVLPTPVNPATRGGHRVYLKRMLLAEAVEGLLPEWAFFARCIVDSTELRPTASREALYDDSLLEATREAIADQLRGWLVRLSSSDPRRLAEFLRIHHLGVKALALHDDEMLRLVEQWWPMETNAGQTTLAEFRARHGLLRYAATTDEFRQLAAVAAAQDVGLINGGYTYDAEIIERLPQLDREIKVERLEPTDLATRFEALDAAVELRLRPFLSAAQRRLDRLGCEVVVRAFEPANLPALYLVSRAAHLHEEFTATRAKADDLWGGVLDALADTEAPERPQLVLNHRNPLVRRVTALGDPDLTALAVEALYGQALLLGYHPIRPADAALLNTSFLGLLGRAVPGEER